MNTKITATIKSPCRLLTFVKEQLARYPFAKAEDCLRFQHCRVNGAVERFGSYRLQPGDSVTIFASNLSEPSTFSILFETEAYTIYQKPPRISTESLVDKVKGYIVHRLDRDTSGCLIVAKNSGIALSLQKMFKQRKVYKEYLAITEGHPKKNSGILTTFTHPIHRRQGAVIMGNSHQGLETITQWQVQQQSKKYALILCRPVTGRTHQIRLHMKTLGCPIVGDVDYGSKKPPENVFHPLLHSLSIRFPCPLTQRKMIYAYSESTLPNLSSLEKGREE